MMIEDQTHYILLVLQSKRGLSTPDKTHSISRYPLSSESDSIGIRPYETLIFLRKD